MKKLINRILNIIILIIILIILYLLWQNHQMKQVEVDNTLKAFDSYEQVTCDNNDIESSQDNPLVTNDDVNSDDIIGYIMFPSLGESTALLQGDLSDDQHSAMARGVSHDPRSSMPGQSGNSIFAGHRELFFKNFLKLKVGDDVVINIGDNIFVYKIENYQVIDPEDVDTVFYDNDQDLLVMYTCYPMEAYKPFNHRVVVKAKPVSKTTIKDCSTVTKHTLAK